MRLADWDDKKVETYQKRWERLNEKSFSRERLHKRLAHLLSTQPGNPSSARFMRFLQGSENREKLYHTVQIPKKRGGTRTITVPHNTLRWAQRSLLQVLTHLFPRHECAHGFERGKSIATHAGRHTNQQYVYTVDIRGFFPSITWGRLYGMFQTFPFEATEGAARHLANLVTHRGALPQGAPTSPILANLLCRKLDSRLFKWARQSGYVYTRYADDLTFSTNNDHVPDEDRAFIDQIIEDEGFQIHPEKKRLMPYFARQMVTGLVVNEKVNVPREYVRGLRALLHNVREHGWESQLPKNRGFLFEDRTSYEAYRKRDISAEKHAKLRKEQKKKHLLVHPGAFLPKAKDVPSLQRVVRSRIAFVGSVKGEDDPVYQRLRQRFEAEAQYEAEIESGRKQYRPLEAPDLPAREGESYYRRLKELERSLDDEELPEQTYRENLHEWSESVLEFGWLLEKNLDFDDLRDETADVAYRLDTTPTQTARFFREFKSDESFRGLLHAPGDIDSSPSEILGACQRALDEVTLPNALRDATRTVLKRCRKWMRDHPGRYPWTDDGDLKQALHRYKTNTRFDIKQETIGDDTVPLDLVARLRPFIEQLEQREAEKDRDVSFDMPKRGKFFRTYVPKVEEALRLLLFSMAEHTQAETVYLRIRNVEPADKPEMRVSIFDEDSRVLREPNLATLLKGDMQRTLPRLRGFARWTMTAPFADEHDADLGSYRFEVLQNKRERLDQAVPGVRHELTFYQ